jgi:hypothetical protein
MLEITIQELDRFKVNQKKIKVIIETERKDRKYV